MKYRNEIDGLRALAVLPVLLYHADFAAFSGGFIGVDVFFVISGYLITTIIVDDLDYNRFSIARFYQRRARRILPALFIVLMVTTPIAWLWMMPDDLNDFLKSILATLLFVSNFLFWDQTGYFDTAADLKPLLHTWSLAVEEQFYIFFPLIMLFLWRLGQKAVLAILVGLFVLSLGHSQWGVQNNPATAFFLPFSRAWELLTGTFVALHMRSRPPSPNGGLRGALSLAGLVLILFPVFIYNGQTPFPGLNALAPVAGTALVILFANEKNLTGMFLSNRLFVSIGLISYSLYLWHQPIFSLFRHRFGNRSFDDHVYLLITLSFGLAVASLWLVERPFRFRVSTQRFWLSMVATLVAIVSGGLWIDTRIDYDRVNIPSYVRILKLAPPNVIAYSEGRDTVMACDGLAPEYGFKFCEFGKSLTKPSLVIWGDSLSHSILFGFDAVAKSNGFSGIMFVADGCPPVLGLSNIQSLQCAGKTHSEILRRISQISSIKAVLIIGNLRGAIAAKNIFINDKATSFDIVKQQIEVAVADIHSASKAKVYLVEQGPIFPEPVARYYIENIGRADQGQQEISRLAHLNISAEQASLAEATDGFISTVDLFCGPETCPAIDENGRFVVYDHNHVTKEFSVDFAQYVLHHLEAELRSGEPSIP